MLGLSENSFKEVKLWLVLLAISLSLACVFEVFSNYTLVRILSSIGAVILTITTLHYGSKGCPRINGHHCYTLLFMTCVGSIAILIAILLIGGIYMLCWFWFNNWPPFNNFTIFPWIKGFALEIIFVILGSICIFSFEKTKMCPDWSDEEGEYVNYEEVV